MYFNGAVHTASGRGRPPALAALEKLWLYLFPLNRSSCFSPFFDSVLPGLRAMVLCADVLFIYVEFHDISFEIARQPCSRMLLVKFYAETGHTCRKFLCNLNSYDQGFFMVRYTPARFTFNSLNRADDPTPRYEQSLQTKATENWFASWYRLPDWVRRRPEEGRRIVNSAVLPVFLN